jgi:hypothetical protein
MPEVEQSTFDWEDLLDLIEDGQLVPVVGKELLRINTAEGERFLEHFVVDALIDTFRLDAEDFPEDCSLNEFSTRYLRGFPPQKRETSKRRIQKRIAEVVASANLQIPEPLIKLAAITQLDLFITTAPYNLLEQALEQVRKQTCISRTHSLHGDIQDVPDESQRQDRPCVFNLFGKLPSRDNPSLDFAVTDEDMIELLHRFNKLNAQFSELSAELQEKSLLLLGSGLPDGVARFLIRSLSNDRLFPYNDFKVVDEQAILDPQLLLFLRGFTNDIYLSKNAIAFVDELHRQWESKVGPNDLLSSLAQHDDNRSSSSVQSFDSTGKAGANGVFISYRRDDAEPVKRLVTALEQTGLPVWQDAQSIRGGDDWLREVRDNIKNCMLFLPIISRNAQTDESEAIREWNLALKRAERMSPGTAFIIPVVIDDTGPGARYIPAEFWEKHFISCPGGEPTTEFSSTIKAKFRERVLARAKGI